MGAVNTSAATGKFGDRLAASGSALADHEWDEEVKRQKTSMTGLDHSKLMGIMRDEKLSDEKRAAAAGTIMGRDYREGHMQALELAGSLGRSGGKGIGSIQKQMSHDMKEKPFALGDQAAGQLGIGTYGQVQPLGEDGTTPPQLGDINEELKDRVETKLSAASLASMNPDELKRIHGMHTRDELTSAQRDQLRKAILEARGNEQYRSMIKPEAAAKHDEILAMSDSEREIDIAHEEALVQNQLHDMGNRNN